MEDETNIYRVPSKVKASWRLLCTPQLIQVSEPCCWVIIFIEQRTGSERPSSLLLPPGPYMLTPRFHLLLLPVQKSLSSAMLLCVGKRTHPACGTAPAPSLGGSDCCDARHQRCADTPGPPLPGPRLAPRDSDATIPGAAAGAHAAFVGSTVSFCCLFGMSFQPALI